MAAALVSALVANHDHHELAGDLANLLRARDVANHLDLYPRLTVSFDLLDHDDLDMVVEGEKDDVIEFLSRCRAEGVRTKAVREDDESEFRLVKNPEETASRYDL